MNRTSKLLVILLILLLSMCGYTFYVKHESIIKSFQLFMAKFKEIEVIVPYEKTVYHNNYNYSAVKETYNFKPMNIDELKNIYYTVLNNGWNEFTFYCPEEYKNCSSDVRKIANENDYINILNNYVSPFNSYKKYNTLLTNEKEVYLTIEKLYTEDEIEIINREIDKIFTELSISKNDDTLTNIKKIHDYLIENITYDEEYDGSEATITNKASTALITKIALCSGYTDSFALMLDRLNIPNFKISNKDHIWNAVYNNGKWLHVDVTWDDDERNKNNTYNFFMIDNNELLKRDDDIHNFNKILYSELK